jgi:hypothetical protein
MVAARLSPFGPAKLWSGRDGGDKGLADNVPRRLHVMPRRFTQRPTMRAFIVACVVAVVLAVAGYYYLSSIQEPVSKAFSTDAVRLD